MSTCTFEWRIEGECDDSWRKITAFDAYFAVAAAAEAYDSEDCGDYPILGGKSIVFEIRCLCDDRPSLTKFAEPSPSGITRWSVYGETVPQYHPHRLPSTD